MFSVDCRELRSTLEKVSSVVENSALHDIYTCVLLKIDKDRLHLTGSNGQVQVSTSCKILDNDDKKSSLSFAVKDRKLNDILRNSVSDKATFKIESNKLKLSVGTGQFSLAIQDGANFPRLEVKGVDLKVSLPQKELQLALKRLQSAISTQTHRIYLAGAYFDFHNGKLSLVGTDGHRLAVDEVKVDSEREGDSFILPRKAVQELGKIINQESEEMIELSATKEDDTYRAAQFSFPKDGLVLVSQLIQGQYPAYAKVIPDEKTNNSHLVFRREHLLDGVRQVSSVHDRQGDTIKIIAKNGAEEIEIVGEGTTTQDHAQIELKLAKGNGFDLQCQINSTYIQEMLLAFDGFDDIDMAFKDNMSSMLCQPAGDDGEGFRYVVMPVR